MLSRSAIFGTEVANFQSFDKHAGISYASRFGARLGVGLEAGLGAGLGSGSAESAQPVGLETEAATPLLCVHRESILMR